MTDAEIFLNLCYYDPRNPESVNNITKCVPCGCPNCFKGTSVLAEELLKVKAYIAGQTTVHHGPPDRVIQVLKTCVETAGYINPIPKKKIYISGPITGQEETAKLQFKHAQDLLEAAGFRALNPFEFNHDHDKTHASYMRVCIKELLKADAIIFLPGWQNSKGALVEKAVAESIGMYSLPTI